MPVPPHLPPVRWVGSSRFSPAYADVQLLAIEQGSPAAEIAELVEMATMLHERGATPGDFVMTIRRPLGAANLQAVVSMSEAGADILSVGTVHSFAATANNAIARKFRYRNPERISCENIRTNNQLSALSGIPYGAAQRQRLANSNVHAASTDVIEAARLVLWAETGVRTLEAATETLPQRVALSGLISATSSTVQCRRTTRCSRNSTGCPPKPFRLPATYLAMATWWRVATR